MVERFNRIGVKGQGSFTGQEGAGVNAGGTVRSRGRHPFRRPSEFRVAKGPQRYTTGERLGGYCLLQEEEEKGAGRGKRSEVEEVRENEIAEGMNEGIKGRGATWQRRR
ncbi:hypothetical protein E2C01_070366 [Portunus trituberculatus]|uniref:Uncharacterized protein n=1 Tax=Portunus trituberculatus TaxID=210409 RepID=A0A5B7I1E0_PORTR|nr:hypothetical protein [Portunus trituberculatus]